MAPATMRRKYPWFQVVVICVLTCATGIVAGNLATLFETRTYTALTSVYVSSRTAGSDTSSAYLGALLAKQRTVSYESVATSDDVAAGALALSRVPDMTPALLSENTKAYSRTDSVVLEISVEDISPLRASILANSVAQSFGLKIAQLESPDGDPRRSPVQIRAVSPAVPPSDPTSPNALSNAVLGGVVGLLFGSILARVLAGMRRRIKDPQDLDDLPNIVIVPPSRTEKMSPRSGQANDGVLAASNELRMRVVTSGVRSGSQPRLIVFTPSSGRATGWLDTALGAAASWSTAGASVLLVDLSIESNYELLRSTEGENVGLDDVLWGRRRLGDVISPQYSGRPYAVLPRGSASPASRFPLSSSQSREIFKSLATLFDVVLVCVSNAQSETDWLPLMGMSDGVVMVVKEDASFFADLDSSVRALNEVSVPLLAVAYISNTDTRQYVRAAG